MIFALLVEHYNQWQIKPMNTEWIKIISVHIQLEIGRRKRGTGKGARGIREVQLSLGLYL